MNLNLKNKVIIITGGTKGIGAGISKMISEEGGIPVFIGRGKDAGQELLNSLQTKGLKGFFIQGDISKLEDCKRIVEASVKKFGSIYGLVNNAGRNDGIGLKDGTPEQFKASLNDNLYHYYNMAHLCLSYLIKSKGSIVNISSKTALTGQGNTSAYAAAKGAQLAMTREWAVELLKYSIRVNAIIPAEVFTPMYKNWIETFDNPVEKVKTITEKIPFENRMTTEEEIAKTAAFLLSDASSHTTGQHIFVDGGYVHLDRSLNTLNN